MGGVVVVSRPYVLFDAAPSLLSALLVVILISTLSMTARAGEMTPVDGAKIAVVAKSTMLDGKVFSGQIGPKGKPAFYQDTFAFKNGAFRSKGCEECGFLPNSYSVRRDGDKIAFVSKTLCPKTGGTIVWRGTVEGDRIEGEYTWTKERWYRTIEKKFWFKGRLRQPEQAATGN